jgi:alkylhydroperoxidase family enzyme
MTKFNTYTPASAPEKSKGFLKIWQERLGFVPNVFGVMAESPSLMKGYNELWGAYEGGLFTPAERGVINMTIDCLNGSSYCLAAHTTICEKAGLPKDVWTALREEKPLKDAKLEALRLFTIAVMKKMGRAEQRDLDAFYKAGYTKAHVLEVVLGVSLVTLGNYVNHIASPELDKAFEPHRIDLGGRKPAGKSSHAA